MIEHTPDWKTRRATVNEDSRRSCDWNVADAVLVVRLCSQQVRHEHMFMKQSYRYYRRHNVEYMASQRTHRFLLRGRV